MENRSPTNAGRWMGRGYGEGRGERGWRSILATPWDENHWPPTEHPFPSSLPIKSWLCFLWPSGPLNTSQDPAAMDDKITQFWLRSFNGNSAGKGSLPPPGNRGRGGEEVILLLLLPWMWTSCLVTAAVLWLWGNHQETHKDTFPSNVLNPLTRHHSHYFWMSRRWEKKIPRFSHVAVSKVVLFLRSKALLTCNLSAFLWQERLLWKPTEKKKSQILQFGMNNMQKWQL